MSGIPIFSDEINLHIECRVQLLQAIGPIRFRSDSIGDAGYQFPYLSHAKEALYHLSYIPSCYNLFQILNFSIILKN